MALHCYQTRLRVPRTYTGSESPSQNIMRVASGLVAFTATAAPAALIMSAAGGDQADALVKLLGQMVRIHEMRLADDASSPLHPAAWRSISELERSTFSRDDESASANDEVTSKGSVYARAQTDGELTDEGVATLLDLLQLSPSSVFADLGSGRGGVLLRVATAAPTRGCFGVEFIGYKHQAAGRLLDAARRRPEIELAGPVQFRQGDMVELASWAAEGKEGAAEEGFSISELSHAFMCSVCFDDVLLRQIAMDLANRTTFPHMQALVSMRALPSQPHFVPVGRVTLCSTWNALAQAHVYVPADLLSCPEQDWPLQMLERVCCASGACTLPPRLAWGNDAIVRLPGRA